MAPNAPPPPSPSPPAEAEPEPELPNGVYRKELSEEQLSGFYEAAYASHEEMLKFLADVLGLRDISYKARSAIIVDYFSGFLLGEQIFTRGWIDKVGDVPCMEVEPRRARLNLGGCEL